MHNECSLPKTILSSHIVGRKNRGRLFYSIKDAIIESIHLMIPSLSNSGCHNYWFRYAQDKTKWNEIIGNIGIKHTSTIKTPTIQGEVEVNIIMNIPE